ncbi:hypothetical protein Mal48_48400 [Thalassoglobus polymorphus]|uniref:Uncharacterized protein n=1 Tax=Thalassoglobus polymorphus TaxID=2527994 RepID=A0A517QVB0_9PLAN|nr:hypothetical protein Mal48_48400 [Thalassoglobus polymorphus]
MGIMYCSTGFEKSQTEKLWRSLVRIERKVSPAVSCLDTSLNDISLLEGRIHGIFMSVAVSRLCDLTRTEECFY